MPELDLQHHHAAAMVMFVCDSAGMTAIYKSAAAHRDVERWCTNRLARWPVAHRTMALATCIGRTHIVAAGEGDGPQQATPCVVVVPGTNFNAATSIPLATALAAHWPTYVVDVPGQPGLSAGDRPGQHRLTQYGRWLQEVLDEVSPGPTSGRSGAQVADRADHLAIAVSHGQPPGS
ncbi:hypothetical protein [Streptomyces sp. Rer75]|uniref:hypothetical protein n=1 Tax=Streptomyces sp. Rer75 TaxID=2750011 RepID=UPI0015CFC4FC|nr:hypothetical protein [Streptomyces sp. Rer75]QLH25323.1 hypothetical protein HYQ63_35735 [Streptomyces sp. Rer75]